MPGRAGFCLSIYSYQWRLFNPDSESAATGPRKKNDILFFSWFPVPLLVSSFLVVIRTAAYPFTNATGGFCRGKTTHFCGFLKLAHLHEDLAHRAASMILRVHLDKMHVDLVSDLALVKGILYDLGGRWCKLIIYI